MGTCGALYQKPEHRQTLTRIHLLRIFRNYILDLSVLASLNMSKSFNDLNLSGIFLKFPKSLKFFMGGYVYLGVTRDFCNSGYSWDVQTNVELE